MDHADLPQWAEFGAGSPEAYFGTCLSGFPNFFMMMGPNTLSGHLSVIFTSECQFGFAQRVLDPVLKSLHPPLHASLFGYQYPDVVAPSKEAELRDSTWVQRKASQLVWSSGCSSWFIDEKTGRNTIMYPDWQWKFWWRSVFVKWDDIVYSSSNGAVGNLGAFSRAACLVALASCGCYYVTSHAGVWSSLSAALDKSGALWFEWFKKSSPAVKF